MRQWRPRGPGRAGCSPSAGVSRVKFAGSAKSHLSLRANAAQTPRSIWTHCMQIRQAVGLGAGNPAFRLHMRLDGTLQVTLLSQRYDSAFAQGWIPMTGQTEAVPAPGSAGGQLQVSLNGEALQMPAGSTLEALLQARDLDPMTHATAVNGQFVPRDARAAHALQDGDTVMCFQAIVGG